MLLKLVVPILLMGFAFRLVFFRSTTVSPILEQTPIAQKNVVPIPNPNPTPNPNPNPPVYVQVQGNEDQVPPKGNRIQLIFVGFLLFLHFLWVLALNALYKSKLTILQKCGVENNKLFL